MKTRTNIIFRLMILVLTAVVILTGCSKEPQNNGEPPFPITREDAQTTANNAAAEEPAEPPFPITREDAQTTANNALKNILGDSMQKTEPIDSFVLDGEYQTKGGIAGIGKKKVKVQAGGNMEYIYTGDITAVVDAGNLTISIQLSGLDVYFYQTPARDWIFLTENGEVFEAEYDAGKDIYKDFDEKTIQAISDDLSAALGVLKEAQKTDTEEKIKANIIAQLKNNYSLGDDIIINVIID